MGHPPALFAFFFWWMLKHSRRPVIRVPDTLASDLQTVSSRTSADGINDARRFGHLRDLIRFATGVLESVAAGAFLANPPVLHGKNSNCRATDMPRMLQPGVKRTNGWKKTCRPARPHFAKIRFFQANLGQIAIHYQGLTNK